MNGVRLPLAALILLIAQWPLLAQTTPPQGNSTDMLSGMNLETLISVVSSYGFLTMYAMFVTLRAIPAKDQQMLDLQLRKDKELADQIKAFQQSLSDLSHEYREALDKILARFDEQNKTILEMVAHCRDRLRNP